MAVCSCLLSINFGKGTIDTTLSDREFWESSLSKSHSLPTGVNEFLAQFSVFIKGCR